LDRTRWSLGRSVSPKLGMVDHVAIRYAMILLLA
jgi:hypothetical protein